MSNANVSQYLELPGFILEKHREGLISLTHMADVIRCGLLAKHGGIWLDATVLLTAPLDKGIRESDFWTIKRDYDDTIASISYYRWNTAAMKGNQELFGLLYELWIRYWREHDHIIDYLLLDYFIELIYQKNKGVRRLINDVELNNLNIFEMQKRLNLPYSEDEFRKITEGTNIFKLQRRVELHRESEGKQTFYGWLCEKFPGNCVH